MCSAASRLSRRRRWHSSCASTASISAGVRCCVRPTRQQDHRPPDADQSGLQERGRRFHRHRRAHRHWDRRLSGWRADPASATGRSGRSQSGPRPRHTAAISAAGILAGAGQPARRLPRKALPQDGSPSRTGADDRRRHGGQDAMAQHHQQRKGKQEFHRGGEPQPEAQSRGLAAEQRHQKGDRAGEKRGLPEMIQQRRRS